MTEIEAIKVLKMVETHGALTTNAKKMAIKALEKQIVKKPTIDEFDYGEGYVCPNCESFLHYVDDDDEHIRTNYCCNCGNKLDWEWEEWIWED
jgi:hypothetical protein